MSGTSGNIKFEMLHRKCIKPSTPTPLHMKTFNLSLLDQLSPDIHGNITFFFNHSHSHSQFSTNSQLLQTSLSQTLTLFYPLAGRLHHHHPATVINCNDYGAYFIEARTTITLSDLLTNPHFNTLESLIPSTDEETVAMSNGSMLLIRFTLFGCGGTAVSISLTHKIADFAALITLLKTWTAVCGGATELPAPELTAGAVLFPPREIPGMSASVITAAGKFTARRFVFNASKVDELKNKVKVALQNAAVEGGAAFHASRVEVVLALIWRCALSAAASRSSKTFRSSALFQAVNLRPRMEPAVSDTAVGNFVWPFAVTVEEESHLELHEMVWRMREAMKEFLETKAGRFKEEGGFEVVMECLKERALLLNRNNKDIVVYKCTSWCKFPLLELDFGWGKPVWSCSVNNLVSNTIALMDTKDGGVEACVTLAEEEMDLFQQDEDLLQYALLNPGVII